MKITRNIWLTRNRYVEPINYVQNTNEIQLEFFLQDFAIENTATLEYCVIQSTGTMYDAPITQFSSETVTIKPTKSTFDEAGQAKLYVRIYQSEESEAVTFCVPVIVAENPFSKDYDGTDEYEEVITRAQLAARIEALESEKVNINQGTDNAGKALVVGDDGKVTVCVASASSGLTDGVKQALLDCFNNVAWSGDDPTGQSYVDGLEQALYPPADLVSISAVYTQSGTVYDNQTLDSLKTDLVVTSHMSDGTSQTVTTYTLSGTLATGTSTITVSYGGKTAAFTVTVTHAVAQYTITNNLTNCTNSNSATVVNEETAYYGTLTPTSGNIMSTAIITMGGTDITSTTYNSETGIISIASVTGNVIITAEAVEDVGWISGVPYDMTAEGFRDGYYLNNGVESVSSSGYACSPYMPCAGAWMLSDTLFDNYNAEYNSEKAYIRKDRIYANHYINFDEYDASFFRVSAKSASVTAAVITPYRLPELTETTVWQSGQYYTADLSNVGSINKNGAVVPTETNYRYSKLMNCYNATKITDSRDGAGNIWRAYAFYDANKDFISRSEIPTAASSGVVNIPSGARFFRLIKVYPSIGVCFALS